MVASVRDRPASAEGGGVRELAGWQPAELGGVPELAHPTARCWLVGGCAAHSQVLEMSSLSFNGAWPCRP